MEPMAAELLMVMADSPLPTEIRLFGPALARPVFVARPSSTREARKV
ncbi:hypothetical protein BH18ACT1_BH18ACT1_13480 [soil metagenome]